MNACAHRYGNITQYCEGNAKYLCSSTRQRMLYPPIGISFHAFRHHLSTISPCFITSWTERIQPQILNKHIICNLLIFKRKEGLEYQLPCVISSSWIMRYTMMQDWRQVSDAKSDASNILFQTHAHALRARVHTHYVTKRAHTRAGTDFQTLSSRC